VFLLFSLYYLLSMSMSEINRIISYVCIYVILCICCFVRSAMLFELWNAFENRLPAAFLQAKILEVGDLLFSMQVLLSLMSDSC